MIAVSGCESASLKNLVDKESNSSTQHEQSHETNIQPTIDTPYTLEHMQKIIQNGNDQQFQRILIPISTVITLYPQHKLFTSKLLHYRFMKCFYRRWKAMGHDNSEDQSELIFIMSLMAQMARTHASLRLPFTRKIALAFLSFDPNIIQEKKLDCQIIKIIAVLLENLSKQAKAVVKLGVQRELKSGLLVLASRVDEPFTLQILLQAIRHLPNTPSIQEIAPITQNLIEHFGHQAANKIKMTLCHVTRKQKKQCLKDLLNQ